MKDKHANAGGDVQKDRPSEAPKGQNSNEKQIRDEPREIPGFLRVSCTITLNKAYAKEINKLYETSQHYIAINDIYEISILSNGKVFIHFSKTEGGGSCIEANEYKETILDRLLRAIHPMYTIQANTIDNPNKE